MRLVQKTVYFREDDIELWNAVENKAAWLHEHLHEPEVLLELSGDTSLPTVKKVIKEPPPKPAVQKVFGDDIEVLEPPPETCVHGNPKGQCDHIDASKWRCNI